MNGVDPSVLVAALTGVFSGSGAPIWGAAIQGIIQLLKGVPQFKPILDGREKLACFLGSLIVVLLAYGVALQAVPPTATLSVLGIVTVLLSWYAVARLAMAAYDDFIAKGPNTPVQANERPTESVLHAKGWTGN